MDRIIKAFQLPGKRKAHSQMIWVCIGSSSKVTDGLFQMATPTFNQAGQIEDVGMPRLQFYSCFNTFCRKIKISLSHGIDTQVCPSRSEERRVGKEWRAR